MKKILQILVLAASVASYAQNSEYVSPQISVFTKNQRIDQDGVEIYSSNLEMKSFKKIGVGIATGGLTGGFGAHGEFNLMQEHALIVGLGRGEAYNSFQLAWKMSFESLYLSPYTKVGYSKWFNNSSNNGSAAKNDILNRVLTESEIRDNKFGTNFIAGGAGLEYNQIEGDLSGLNFFGELLVLTELSSSIFLPTASVGMTYFY